MSEFKFSEVTPVDHTADHFVVNDDSKAEWAMRKLGEAETELAKIKAQAEEWVDQIQVWMDDRSKAHQDTVDHMSSMLENYALALRNDTEEKVKSVNLPSGIVRTTSSKARLVIENPDEMLTWIDENIGLVKAETDGVVKTTRKIALGKLGDVLGPVEVNNKWVVLNKETGEQLETKSVSVVEPKTSASATPRVIQRSEL